MQKSKVFCLFRILIVFVVICIYLGGNNSDAFADDVYEVWIGDTQVSTENKDYIPGSDSGYATYDPDKKTLTFFNYIGTASPLKKEAVVTAYDDLSIKGDAYFIESYAGYGLYSSGTLTIDADISIEGNVAIVGDNIVINGGSIEAKGIDRGIDALNGSISFNGGVIKASGHDMAIRFSGQNANLLFNNGMLPYYIDECGEYSEAIVTRNNQATAKSDYYSGTLERTDNGVDGDLRVKSVVISKEKHERYDVWIGKTQITSDNKDKVLGKNGGYASYNPDSKTLTFFDFKDVIYTSGNIVYSENDLTIQGTATFDGVEVYEKGIYSAGKLTVSGNIDIKVVRDGFEGVSGVVISGDNSEINIYTADISGPCITSGRGIVEILGGNINLFSKVENSYGISAEQAIISGGKLVITADHGINCAYGSIDILGGEIIITSKMNSLIADNVSIINGSVFAEDSYEAIVAAKVITIDEGMVISEPKNTVLGYDSFAGPHIYESDGKKPIKKITITRKSEVITPTPEIVTPDPSVVTPTPDIVTPTPDVVIPTPSIAMPTPSVDVTAVPMPDVTGTPIVTDMPEVTFTPEVTRPLEKHKKGDLISDETDGTIYIITSVKAGSETVSLYEPGKVSGKFLVADTVTIDKITYLVTGVYKAAFKNQSKITSVKLGKYIKSIGDSAFESCFGLKTFTFNKKITKIGAKAFYGCKSLSKLVIPASVSSIGKDAFKGCSSLSKLYIKTIKLTEKSVGKNVFKNINKSLKIYVPKSLKKEYLELLSSKGYSKKKVNVIKDI